MTQKIVLPLLLLAFALPAVAEVKFGLVDMQKAIQETADGKKAKKELESDFSKKKKDLEKKQADIKKMGEDLDKKALVLSDEVKGKKQVRSKQKWRNIRKPFRRAKWKFRSMSAN